MAVQDVMTQRVRTIGPAETLRAAAAALAAGGFSGLPVAGLDGRLVGMITEGDIGRALAEHGEALTVGQAMTAPVVTVHPIASVARAARLMVRHGVKRLPVVLEDGRMVGIVSRADVVRACARPDEQVVAEIRRLLAARRIPPGAVSVAFQDGEAVLGGELGTRSGAQRLCEAVAEVPGVFAVVSRLRWRDENGSVAPSGTGRA